MHLVRVFKFNLIQLKSLNQPNSNPKPIKIVIVSIELDFIFLQTVWIGSDRILSLIFKTISIQSKPNTTI